MVFSPRNAAAAAFIAALSTQAAVAQDVFGGTDDVNDAVTNVEEQVQDDFDKARESRSFGAGPAKLGWTGSVSASASAVSGNSDTQDLGVGARFGFSDGINGHDVGLSYTYSKDNGEISANTLGLGYDYTRFFNSDFYGYGQLRYKYDEFGAFEEDGFVGAGVGYRVVNTDDVTWSVQAGPGWRVARAADGSEIDEVAGSATSKLYYGLQNGVFLTNTTDIIASESDTAVTNELGLSVALTGPLALRTSLRTEYHSDPVAGAKSTDNTLGMSLVYSFN